MKETTEMFAGFRNLRNILWPTLPETPEKSLEISETIPVSQEENSVLVRFLKDRSRLFEVIPVLADRVRTVPTSTLFTLIVGLVQSGKARIAYALLLYLTVEMGHNVGMIFRDYTGDYEQFRFLGGLEPFLQEYEDYAVREGGSDKDDVDIPPIYYVGDVGMTREGVLTKHERVCMSLASGGTILLALGNKSQMIKMNEVLDLVLREGNTMTLSVVIDEADLVMYSEGEAFKPQLDRLLEKSAFAYDISGTVMDILQDNRLKTADVFAYTAPAGYKGLRDIVFKEIEPIDEALKKEKPDAFLEWDASLCRFLVEHADHNGFDIHDGETHPMIAFLKTERMIRHQDALLNAIVEDPRFTDAYTVIVYNGEYTKLYSPSLVGIDPGRIHHYKRHEKGSTSRYHVYRHCPIQYVLQYLKDNGGAARFPRILVISHLMLARSGNVVSADYRWHLTREFFRPAPGASVATMTQSIRLCGVYKDTIPLVCYMESRYYDALYKGSMIQEDILWRIKQGQIKNPTEMMDSMREWLSKQSFLEDKIPKSKLVRQGPFVGKRTRIALEDTGMSLHEFFRNHCLCPPVAVAVPVAAATATAVVESVEMDDEEFRSIAKIFQKWGRSGNSTSISQMMHHVDPLRWYTEQEMTTLCKEYRQTLGHFLKKRGGSYAYGHIFVEADHHYRLHPRLVEEFEKNF